MTFSLSTVESDFAAFVPGAKQAIENVAVQAVQAYVTEKFGATVSADGLKLVHDAVALAAKPSLDAALADLPDFIKLVQDLSPSAVVAT